MDLQKQESLKKILQTNKDKAIELYYEKYLGNHSNLVKHNVEIDEMIKHLKDNGMKLGIVTGKARRSLDISLKALQMDNYFDVIITGNDVIHPKPHPEGIIKALSLLGVENNDAMFVGDSDADIQAGKEANVHTVGVQWLQDYQDTEFKIEPDSFFTNVKQFVEFINTGE